MYFSHKNRSFFAILALSIISLTTPLESAIRAVFWSKPTIFDQDRLAIVKELGVFNSLWNIANAGGAQEKIFNTMVKHYGAQTQTYKVADPQTNEPLPLIMRQWLTGEKSPDDLQKAAKVMFKDKDSASAFYRKITEILFKPETLIKVTKAIGATTDLVKRITRQSPHVMQILASNYDAASFAELRKSKVGQDVLPLFNYIYNSGMLKNQYQGIILQDPAFFKLIMDQRGLQPHECLVINSDPAIIAAAQSLGMQTIYYEIGKYDMIKDSLKQLNLIR